MEEDVFGELEESRNAMLKKMCREKLGVELSGSGDTVWLPQGTYVKDGPPYIEEKVTIPDPFEPSKDIERDILRSNSHYYDTTLKAQEDLENSIKRERIQKAKEAGKIYYPFPILGQDDFEPASYLKGTEYINTEHYGFEEGDIFIVDSGGKHEAWDGATVEVMASGYIPGGFRIKVKDINTGKTLWISPKFLVPREEDIYRP